MLKINGVNIPDPKSYEFSLVDIDGETNRNARGEMLRDRITTKRKLQLEWAPLNMSECSSILKAVQDVFFQVAYPDAFEGKSMTKTFYVGDRTAPAYSYINGQVKWQGLKMDFIEK